MRTDESVGFTWWNIWGLLGLVLGSLVILGYTYPDSKELGFVLILVNGTLCIMVLRFNKYAFLIATVLTFNPLLWIINGFYLKRRWNHPKVNRIAIRESELQPLQDKENNIGSKVGRFTGDAKDENIGASLPHNPIASPTIAATSSKIYNSTITSNASAGSLLPMPATKAVWKPTDKNIEEEFWAKALTECDGPNRRPGLWARVFSEAQGNEAVAKANYLKHRVAEFLHEHQQHRLAQEQTEREAVEQARLALLSEEQRAYELLPKGKCPNCDVVIPLASEACPTCDSRFTARDGWRVIPI